MTLGKQMLYLSRADVVGTGLTMAVAPLFYRQAVAKGIGTWLPL